MDLKTLVEKLVILDRNQYTVVGRALVANLVPFVDLDGTDRIMMVMVVDNESAPRNMADYQVTAIKVSNGHVQIEVIW